MWYRVSGLIAFLSLAPMGIARAADAPQAAVVGRQTVNGHSSRANISADGRFVAFDSYATNLVAGDKSQTNRVLVHERSTGATKVVNATGGGAPANGSTVSAVLTADGRYVAFASDATNLIPEDTNLFRDIFVRELRTGKTERVSVHTNGAQAVNGHSSHPSISADGRFVAFESAAINLAGGDTNGLIDIFVHDRQTGATIRANVSTERYQAYGGPSYYSSISADGRYVVFVSDATNLVPGDTNKVSDVFVHDRVKVTTTRASVGSGAAQAIGGPSVHPAISADGRYVAFASEATNLVPGDTNGFTDIFVHDRVKGATQRVSVASGGAQADAGSARPSISTDGRYVAFESGAANLVPDDTNDVVDVFVRDRQTNKTTRVSVVTDDTASKTAGEPQSKGERK